MSKAFDVFSGFTKENDVKIQAIYESQEHYFKLLKKYKDEIAFIENMLEGYRQERKEFMLNELPAISVKLKEEGVADDIRVDWLSKLEKDMENSFALSELVLREFVGKKIEDFNEIIQRRIQEIT